MKIPTLVFALAMLAAPAFAASLSVPATFTVLKPIAIGQQQPLAFGRLMLDSTSTSASVSLTPAGGLSLSGATAIGPHTAGAYNLSGEPGSILTISVDPTVALNNAGGGPTITATTSTDNPGTLTLNGSGNGSVNVGAAFTFPAGALTGAYSGSFTVTAVYQ